MNKHVLHFSQFVNENYSLHNDELSKLAKETFNDFPFERRIISLIESMESLWQDLENTYDWNRSYRGLTGDHFAINAKIHTWAESDKVREILNISELTDEEIGTMWNSWLLAKAEMFGDSIDYWWVKNVSWWGASGGWLIIEPDLTFENTKESIEEDCREYQNEKNEIGSPEEIAKLAKYYSNPDYKQMIANGMIKEPDGLQDLRIRADGAYVDYIKSESQIKEIKTDLEQIVSKIKNFRLNADSEFYEYLKEDPDNALSEIM